MLDADEERLLILEEEFRELTLKEADILLQLTDVCCQAARPKPGCGDEESPRAYLHAARRVAGFHSSGNSASDRPQCASRGYGVARRNRWAVTDASSLWTSIELYWGVESDEDRFAAYLARSRTYILSVTAKYGAFYGKEEFEYEEVPNQLATFALHIS
ncbi:hypothetical protein B0H14DRAFT_1136496 [Mycena olivaceomarginata]|nr:hypothetical protein B0H14DRAFT_1136496 [Mycena olivaceomarginata]